MSFRSKHLARAAAPKTPELATAGSESARAPPVTKIAPAAPALRAGAAGDVFVMGGARGTAWGAETANKSSGAKGAVGDFAGFLCLCRATK